MIKRDLKRSDREHEAFGRRVLAAVGISVAVILFLLFIWFAMDVLLLAFAGILLAIFLRGLSDIVHRHSRLSEGWSLALVIAGLGLIIGLGMWRLVPDVAAQVDELAEVLPQSIRKAEQYLQQYNWGRQLLNQIPSDEEPDRANVVLGRAARFFSTTLGAVLNLLLLLVIGIYLAAEPKLYSEGIVRLVAIDKRQRAREVLRRVGETLKWWLLGQIFSMLVIGVLTTVGLALFGVPLALVLGLLAAFLAFIPNLGPILALIPAALLAWLESPAKALYVILLYFGIQLVETYLLTPFVNRHTVSLPPALTITGQLALGALIGGLGLMLATPLVAAGMVIITMLYVEDTLGDSSRPSAAISDGKD